MPLSTTTNGSCSYPVNCPNEVLPRADKQTWAMNASTIIMPCNNTGFTDPQSTKGWGIVDFDCEFSPNQSAASCGLSVVLCSMLWNIPAHPRSSSC